MPILKPSATEPNGDLMHCNQHPLPKRAAQFRKLVEEDKNFLATCDGGDVGSAERRSIWLLGIEPGWSIRDQQNENTGSGISKEDYESYSVKLQLQWPFNRNAFKLLSALSGNDPRQYKKFAEDNNIFERNSPGYFKGNLFPAACNNLGVWRDEHRQETGFCDKSTYRDWMRKTRFPILKAWIKKCSPKLIICSGLTHLCDFLTVTDTLDVPKPHTFGVNGYPKRVYVASNGIVPIAVIPHLSGGTHSLNSFQAISETAKYIKNSLPDLHFDASKEKHIDAPQRP